MLYKVIYDIINMYSYDIKIINDDLFEYKCSQCRKFYLHTDLKETNEQSWRPPPRIYCEKCRKFFGNFFSYKEFK